MYFSIQPRLTCSHPIPTQPVSASVSCVGLGVNVDFGGVDGGGCRAAGRFGHFRVGAGGGSGVGGVSSLGCGGRVSDEVDDDDRENKLPTSKYNTRTIYRAYHGPVTRAGPTILKMSWNGPNRAEYFENVMDRAGPRPIT